jgi:hypothetical protein
LTALLNKLYFDGGQDMTIDHAGINKESDVFRRDFTCRCSLIFISLFLFCMCSCASAPKQSDAEAWSNNLGVPINDFRVITPNVLWHGGSPDEKGAAWLIDHRVGTVVSLEFLLEDLWAFREATVSDANTYEVGYFRIYGFDPFNIILPWLVDDQVAHFIAIVTTQPKPVFFHCLLGGNRSGVMIAAYRMLVENVSLEEALEELDRGAPGWWARMWLFLGDVRYTRGLFERREELRRKVDEWIPKLQKEARIICAKGTCEVSPY